MDTAQTKLVMYRQTVEDGGGIWIGIQDTLEPPALVLFKSPNTNTTLALYEDLLTVERVQDKITRSDRAFSASPIKVKRQDFDHLLGHLQEAIAILAKTEEKR